MKYLLGIAYFRGHVRRVKDMQQKKLLDKILQLIGVNILNH